MGLKGFRIWIMISIVVSSIIMKSQNFLVKAQPQVPCIFFFGDSIMDNGNNNDLQTSAKANYPPYGIDFPSGIPTGRFSNGENIADFIAKFVGFNQPIFPFVQASGMDILRGVNHASGAGGILDESGKTKGDRFTMNRQLQNHQTYISRLAVLLGNRDRANDRLRQCLYTLYIGNNDYANNYFLPQFYKSSKLYTPQQFADLVIRQYSQQLRTLYNLEARKIAIFGVGRLGCAPVVLAQNPVTKSGCVDSVNEVVDIFNNQLNSLVNTLNHELPGARFIYINTTSLAFGDWAAQGFKVANAPCCPVADNGQCAIGKVPCNNRNEYVFYDSYHPGELFSKCTAARAYKAALPTDANPTDIHGLVQNS